RPEEPSKREMGYDYGLVGQRPEDEVDLEKESARSLPLWGDEKPKRFAGAVVFAGIESKYFAICLAPEEQQGSRAALLFSKEGSLDGARGDFEGRLPGALWHAADVDVPPATSVQHRYVFYAGPKRDEELAPFTTYGMDKVANVKSRVPLASTLSALFLELLGAFVAVVRSYGIAIILLTLLVRALLHPLSRASQRSTYKMQKLAPVVNEIRERYKGKTSREQQQKMNMEIMELYKRNGASPLAGCLPMLLQFPVIIGLYNALAYDIELRQTQFLYIRDLSKPDRLMDLGMNLPWPLEGYLNLLPILMVVLMIVQQRLAPKPADPQQQQQMKIMQYVMVLFGVMFYTVPSGLGLYFLTSSTVGALETRWIRRQLEKEELVTSAAPPPAPRATRQPKKSRRVKGGRPGEKREKRKKFV
ncbi:MAG: membrane protein insertase YidC, partial [Planctomycetota bacterium]